ncbi:alpha-glucosidase [Linepithema humile]|uniref:alpha-glucosidase n=1 Tax=Linepithema humile TaxID=83485 RepID=UPI0006234534|nr:PREDICTED: neutral and basic amino acid transport protein rBAT isoform X2 [Linepithema humile]
MNRDVESGRDGSEVNGASKETPSLVANKVEDEKEAMVRQDNTMGKQNPEDLDDGAQERMLKDENAAKITEKNATEVKFISENGDAKIDIEMIKEALSGMSKEELMKFANDPFWVRLRWALFILFWLLWAAMLAGAIAIIVMAPKCSAPEPKKLWEESPIIQLDASTDSFNGDLKGLESVLNNLTNLNVKAISLSSLVKEAADGGVDDFNAIKPQLGNISDLESLIEVAKKNGQQIFLELDPNHSSVEHPWFKQSVEKQEPYTSYYIWANGITKSEGGKERPSPPNNWLSVYGGSAWEWNEQRGQYYLHQFNKSQPDLNYANPEVVKEFGNVLTYWLKLGISGFRLENSQYLTEDPDLRNESRSFYYPVETNYHSLIHIYTRNRPENVAVLNKWHEIVYNETNGKGLFSLQDPIPIDILQIYNETKKIDLPQSSHFLVSTDADRKLMKLNATTLNTSITQWLNVAPWPAWNLNSKQHILRELVPTDTADSIILMTMLLPGTPILRLNDTKSIEKAFTTLSNARRGLTFLHGNMTSKIINETVFVYERLKSGNPGYLVVHQTAAKKATIDLSVIPQISEEVNVLAFSPNYVQDEFPNNKKYPSKEVPISPMSTLILTFVPTE